MARAKRPERECAAETKKRQQLLVQRRETSQTGSRQLMNGGKSAQNLHSEIDVAKAEMTERLELATEVAEELNMA